MDRKIFRKVFSLRSETKNEDFCELEREEIPWFFFFFCLMFSYSLLQPRQFPSVGKDGGSRQGLNLWERGSYLWPRNCGPQSSHSVVSNSLWSHGLQHARLSSPSPTPRACSKSCPLSWWCHPIISSSVVPFSSHVQSFPLILSFLVNHFFTSGSLSIGASASVLPVNIQSFQKNMISFGID